MSEQMLKENPNERIKLNAIREYPFIVEMGLSDIIKAAKGTVYLSRRQYG